MIMSRLTWAEHLLAFVFKGIRICNCLGISGAERDLGAAHEIGFELVVGVDSGIEH